MGTPRDDATPLLDDAAARGYLTRLLEGGSPLTRLSHRRRVDGVRRLLTPLARGRIADVGCADGWLLRALVDEPGVEHALGVEIDPAMRAAAQERSVGTAIEYLDPDAPALSAHRGRCDLVTCLETAEHVADVDRLLDTVFGLARPGGTVVISAPVEVGPSVVAKQLGRWWANRGGGYGYERYRIGELTRAGILWRAPHTRDNLHSHKGFDYRELEQRLEARAALERRVCSPLPMPAPILASTVAWILRAPH